MVVDIIFMVPGKIQEDLKDVSNDSESMEIDSEPLPKRPRISSGTSQIKATTASLWAEYGEALCVYQFPVNADLALLF
jgi:hypothetical protein